MRAALAGKSRIVSQTVPSSTKRASPAEKTRSRIPTTCRPRRHCKPPPTRRKKRCEILTSLGRKSDPRRGGGELGDNVLGLVGRGVEQGGVGTGVLQLLAASPGETDSGAGDEGHYFRLSGEGWGEKRFWVEEEEKKRREKERDARGRGGREGHGGNPKGHGAAFCPRRFQRGDVWRSPPSFSSSFLEISAGLLYAWSSHPHTIKS